MTLTWHVGDTRKVLVTLPTASVNCVVTSSPYLAKRAYLPADHPDKPLEQGQEASPGEFLAGMLEVTDLLWDVLADDGVLFWNLGDTASGSGGAGGDYNAGGLHEGQQRYRQTRHSTAWRLNDDGSVKHTTKDRLEDPKNVPNVVPVAGGRGWPRAKSVCWVPELFGASLAYGRNLLSGQPCQQWVTRPSLIWAKPNPSVGAIHDKMRESTELVVMAVKQQRYWFDIDAVRVPPKGGLSPDKAKGTGAYNGHGRCENGQGKPNRVANDKGAPPHTFLDDGRDLPAAIIGAPAQYASTHYAVMPPWLARLLVTVGCPPGGTVLDPYAGSGTTLEAAHGLGRSSIGIDLDERNPHLAQDRLGMFPLDVTDHRVAS